MRPLGFSTGALAKSDFRRGIALQKQCGVTAIELSALRDHELQPLVQALPTLELDEFEYVSFHAPSRLSTLGEDDVISWLLQLPEAWPIVVHPEIVRTAPKWRPFGRRLCLENMDNRKTSGRTVDEMRTLFALLPEASFCLDVGHARQIDPTMTVALMMLTEFNARLVQLHVSEVGPFGEHLPVRVLATIAFQRIAHRVPDETAVIIESVVAEEEMERELTTVSELFSAHTPLVIG
jgi:hypothetical protein